MKTFVLKHPTDGRLLINTLLEWPQSGEPTLNDFARRCGCRLEEFVLDYGRCAIVEVSVTEKP